MKWIIKNPAPADRRKEKWGDFHFGRSLTRYLERLGEVIETDYQPNWQNKKKADVVLVIRGRHRYEPQKNSLNIMWNISHPRAVSLEEYNSYDLIFVASHYYAEMLKNKIKKPLYPLLQCTDTEEFYPRVRLDNSCEKDIIFVGNTRAVARPCIIWAAEYGLPLKIWGRGWEKWVSTKFIAGKYIDNKNLGTLYARSRATLNDHWEDMKEYNFINNRVFNALACGLPVISDYLEELFALFPEEILYYRNKEEFYNCIKQLNFFYPRLKSSIAAIFPKIEQDFSFKHRAEYLLKTVKKF